MWLNCTRTKVNLADMGKVVEILAGEDSPRPIRTARGFCHLYLIESTEAPGVLVSISVWESAEDGQSYLASPECRMVIESIQEYMLKPLERNYYEVHMEVSVQNATVKR